jgi:LPS export ABC transporter protein LptC
MRGWQWIALLVAALSLALLLGRPHPQDDAPVSIGRADEPDLDMGNAVIAQFNADGSLRYRLRCTQIRHFEGEATTRLEEPALEFSRAPQPSWWVTARSGYISYRSGPADRPEEVVFLSDDVRFERREDARFIEITTKALYVYPGRRFAETDQAVMIATHAGSTTAAGLSGDLEAGRVRLSSRKNERVHTIVLPGQFKRSRRSEAS